MEQELGWQKECDRRDFVKGTVWAVLAAPKILRTISSSKAATAIDIAGEIGDLDTQIGDRLVTPEEAHRYDWLVANLIVSSTDTGKTVQDLAGKIYLIRRSPYLAELVDFSRSPDLVFNMPTMIQLQRDYPSLNLSSSRAWNIMWNMWRFSGLFDNGSQDIFINLDKINYYGAPRQLVYDGQALICRSNRSRALCYRTVVLHEYHHKISSPNEPAEVEPEIIQAVYATDETVRQKADNFGIRGTYKTGFGVGINYQDNESSWTIFDRFDEFVSDFLTAARYTMFQLPYADAFYAPIESMENLSRLISRMGLSPDNLFRLYRDREIKKLLLVTAQVARDTQFASEQEMLEFAVPKTIGSKTVAPDWGYLQSFYPEVNPRLRVC